MGLWDWLRGESDVERRRREGRAVMDPLVGVSGTATVSRDGFPICPRCDAKFPVSAARMRESGGFQVMVCPKCGTQARID
jgi:hypothetical protein